MCIHKDIIYADIHFLHTGNHRDRNTDRNINVSLLPSYYCNMDGSAGIQTKPFYLLNSIWGNRLWRSGYRFSGVIFLLRLKYGCVWANLFDCCLSLKSIQALTKLVVNFDRNIVTQTITNKRCSEWWLSDLLFCLYRPTHGEKNKPKVWNEDRINIVLYPWAQQYWICVWGVAEEEVG